MSCLSLFWRHGFAGTKHPRATLGCFALCCLIRLFHASASHATGQQAENFAKPTTMHHRLIDTISGAFVQWGVIGISAPQAIRATGAEKGTNQLELIPNSQRIP
jgi:hypothetical protein